MAEYCDESPLLGEPSEPPREGLNKMLIYGLALGGGVLLFAASVWAVSTWLMPPPPPPPPLVQHEPQGLQTPPPKLETLITDPFPTSFANQDRRPPMPEAQLVQDIPSPSPPTKKDDAASPPPPPSEKKPPEKKAPVVKTEGQPATTTTPKKPQWGFLAKGSDRTAPPPPPTEPGTARKGAHLIDTAAWAIPQNVNRTLYRTQVLPCEVVQLITSDAPGQVKFRLTVPAFGYYGQGDELFPRGSEVVGKSDSKAVYGESSLLVKLEEVQLPSGAIVEIPAEVGNEDGSSQLKGTTNNHWDTVFLSAFANALVSLGGGYLAGTPPSGEYFLDPAQRAMADAARSAQQDARSVIGRELKRGPTITRDPKRKGERFCTIQMLKNIQFSDHPVMVKQEGR